MHPTPISEDTGALYSPKLKEAMEQIQKILKANDIAGLCILYDRGFGEFLNHLETSNSVFFYEQTQDGLAVRFRSKLEDFGGDREAQRKATEYSVGYLRICLDIMAMQTIVYKQVYNHISQRMDIEHSGPGLTTCQ